jgi:hypothetical protein
MPLGKVKCSRRTLHFEKIDEVLAEVDKLARAEAAGTLTTSGNWTLGQSVNHMASWVDYGYDGMPVAIPLTVRLIMRVLKRPILRHPIRAGSRIPKVPGGTLAIESASTVDGLAHFRRSFTRLRDETPTRPHIAFGAMSHDEWIALHLRHAELHLSFFNPG